MHISLDLSLAQLRQMARLVSTPDGSFIFVDGAGMGYQTAEIRHEDLARSLLRLQVELHPEEGGTAAFCLLRPNRQDLVRVERDGIISAPVGAEVLEATCQGDGSGWFHLDIRFRNFPPLLQLAMAQPGPRYDGRGQPQFRIRNLSVEALEPRWTPSAQDGLIVLATGTTARLEPAWVPYLPGLRAILCEPDEAAGRAALAALPGDRHVLLPNALSNRNGVSKFNIAKQPAMSSVFDADQRRVKPFANAAAFEVTDTTKVQLTRFDTLSRQMDLPQPDLLRIRAGGGEFDVLRGCGSVLDKVLAIEVQAHVYPIYRKQKLIGDIIDLLDGYGFALRRLIPHPVASTSHEIVATTAYLTRRKVEGAALGKVAFIEETWGVSWPR